VHWCVEVSSLWSGETELRYISGITMVICRTILEDTNLIIGIVICCGCLEDCPLELKELRYSVFIVTKKNSCKVVRCGHQEYCT
jgi:hypothetical protein